MQYVFELNKLQLDKFLEFKILLVQTTRNIGSPDNPILNKTDDEDVPKHLLSVFRDLIKHFNIKNSVSGFNRIADIHHFIHDYEMDEDQLQYILQEAYVSLTVKTDKLDDDFNLEAAHYVTRRNEHSKLLEQLEVSQRWVERHRVNLEKMIISKDLALAYMLTKDQVIDEIFGNIFITEPQVPLKTKNGIKWLLENAHRLSDVTYDELLTNLLIDEPKLSYEQSDVESSLYSYLKECHHLILEII